MSVVWTLVAVALVMAMMTMRVMTVTVAGVVFIARSLMVAVLLRVVLWWRIRPGSIWTWTLVVGLISALGRIVWPWTGSVLLRGRGRGLLVTSILTTRRRSWLMFTWVRSRFGLAAGATAEEA